MILIFFLWAGQGQNWPGLSRWLINYPLHAEMNSACSGYDEHEEEKGEAGRRELPGVERVDGLAWWCAVRLEAARTAACTGHGWKKKEQSPAKEKESSRLELLVWLRKELLPRLPLGRKRAYGQGGGRCLCCRRRYYSHGGRGEDFYKGERERSGATVT